MCRRKKYFTCTNCQNVFLAETGIIVGLIATIPVMDYPAKCTKCGSIRTYSSPDYRSFAKLYEQIWDIMERKEETSFISRRTKT